jgi:hypothetical protein
MRNGYINHPNYGIFVEPMNVSKDNTNLKMSTSEQKEIEKYTTVSNLTDDSETEPVKESKEEIKEKVHETAAKDLLNDL